MHDLLAKPQPIEELWQKWQQPEIWRLPHGHISTLFVPGLTNRVLRWLAPRLQAVKPRPKTPPTESFHSTPRSSGIRLS